MNRSGKIILASSSPFRKELLGRLGLKFSTFSPEIDESPLKNESPADLVTRLARQKAEKIAKNNHDALIIASDQVACLGDDILGKPKTHDRAMAQLGKMRGNTVGFITSLHVIDAEAKRAESTRVEYLVRFRDYSDDEMERYLRTETPYDCA
ncbi:MAG: septum formation protein Maf, partial [Gammaproteobacteria bacterium]|nr:septum formation protein Maf [Gammaproteobacteria bacterium]